VDPVGGEHRPFRVLVTSAGFEPGFRGGGPIRSLTGIVDTVTEKTELYLITRDRDLGASDPYPGLSGHWVNRGDSRIFYLNVWRPGQWFELWRQLRAMRFDLLYVNSLWDPVFTVIPIVAVRVRLIHAARLLLAPRGELAPGALSLKRSKKRLFLRQWAFFLKGMHPVWHASSDREASQIRALNPWAHVEVSQNPVSLPLEPLPPTVAAEGPTRLVFIGRLAPVKNLHSVLTALVGLSGPVEFDIYGPVEDGAYWAKCQQIIGRLPSHVRVAYGGELAPEEVRPTFSRYDAFVFPTLGENFGHIVAESLSASCPVICPDTTPWTEVLEAGGGIVLRDPSFTGWTHQIDHLAAMSPKDRLRARERAGRAYRSWRSQAFRPNILEQAREAAWPARR
jgi:glycosyltransferase involved in cell wall biosynthesis